jgi:multidrug efflux pump subunit AcrA (membrane-fusion protein)
MKKNNLFFYLSILLVLSCSDKSVSILPSSNDITESVYASGKVKAVNQYNVYSTVNGILKNIPVTAGDTIKKGQILFELDNLANILNTKNAQLALELSEENNKKGSDKLQEMDIAVSQALDKLTLDSTLFIRQKKLWEQNIGTQVDFDQRKLAYETSKTNYLTSKSKFAQIKTQLENEFEKAKVNYNLTEKIQNDYRIASEVNGKLYDVLKEKGELVTPQTPLAVIGELNDFLLELEVDENDIIKISKGQLAIITMDSYKGAALEAIVTKIYPIMNESSRTFKIEASFAHPPKKLFPNLTVEANIVIQTKKNVLTIPKEYLIDEKYVLINKNEKHEVKIGLRDYQKLEIVEGLSKDDKIYLPK